MRLACVLAATALVVACPSADAAESYDNCAGTLASLPATITTQGVWCMKSDLATAITSGSAISVQANNVTIECNGFKLGGLAGGPASVTVGIHADNRQNTTIRGCNLRGFADGIVLEGDGSGHLVEDNRFDGIRATGARIHGDGSIVRRNLLVDTGVGSQLDTFYVAALRLIGNVHALENQITGVDEDAQLLGLAVGILIQDGEASVLADNRISGVRRTGDGGPYPILSTSTGAIIRDNVFINDPAAAVGDAVSCMVGDPPSVVKDNVASGFLALGGDCIDGGGNVVTD